MKVEVVRQDTVAEFFAYCRTHRLEVDDSYLYEEDLTNFVLGEENPTFVIRQAGQITAAVSLILDDYHLRGNRGRFRIFHAQSGSQAVYQALFDAISPAMSQVDHVILFVQDTQVITEKAMKALGFFLMRTSCFLVRESCDIQAVPELPAGFSLRAFRPGVDEVHWTSVRNQAFAQLLGNQTPLVVDQVVKMIQEDGHLPQGMILLFDGDRAVGVVRGTEDEYEDRPVMNIGPLAILPEYQGRGLGRILLRSVIAFGKEAGYGQVVLSVNAENENAKALYVKEGFVQVEGIYCFRFNVK